METGKITIQSELLFNRLTKRHKHLSKWAKRTGTNSFRLFDRDIPEIPLVLDLYGDAVSGAVYKGPEQSTETWLAVMKEAIAMALNVNQDFIFLKERQRLSQRQKTGNQYSRLQTKNIYRDAMEGDLQFRVNVSDYLDTGLFLDARKKRELIRSEAKGKRVLNLFAYTSTLSVCAAKGGASQVDSVDLSNTYLEWGKVNFAMNRLTDGLTSNTLNQDSKFNFIQSDVMQFMAQAEKKKLRWDLIILDPPSFSNSKKMRGNLDIKRDHRELINRSLSLLSPEGTLWFSTNAKGFSLDNGDFPDLQINDITNELVDEDFKGKRIPANMKLRMKNEKLKE